MTWDNLMRTYIPGLYDTWEDKDFLRAIQNNYNQMRCNGEPRDESIEALIKQLRSRVEREMEE